MNRISVVFDPAFGWEVVWLLAALGAVVTGLALWRGLSGWWLRGLALLAVLAALAGPAIQSEDLAPLGDIALVLRDETGSNRLHGRAEQTDAAASHLLARLQAMGLEPREVTLSDGAEDAGTLLGAGLEAALSDIPRDRLAGVFVVSDGISHDAIPADGLPAPLHLVQTGTDADWDRRLIIRNAPTYGILGEALPLVLRVEDQGAVPEALRGQPVRVGFSLNGEPLRYAMALPGRDVELTLTLDRGGMNVLHFTVEEGPGELTTRNNEAVVQINGIRDRLRVLLVSGEPHTGQRTWRNILKSDPSVDLVHFTILRPPDRQDGVPVNELSLIAFPTRELFIEKIDEFDLIIFDRYRRRGILPNAYFDNIRRYVVDGGALLVVGGQELASAESIYYSPLGRIFPAEPTARVFEQAFVPRLSETGARHPVTAGLTEGYTPREDGAPGWGRWLRQIDLTPRSGEVVMEGIGPRPLLVLDRVGEGRIALMASDQAWLWDRGFEGGGPQAELLRRLAHWMMAEPELEEEALEAQAQGLALTVTRQSLQDGPHSVDVTGPDGQSVALVLEPQGQGRFSATWQAPEPGLFRLVDGELERVIVLGPGNPREYQELIATPVAMEAALAATRGAAFALQGGLPEIRAVPQGRQAHGRGWLGVTPRGASEVVDLRLAPVLPAWAWLLLAAMPLLAGWLREGRR